MNQHLINLALALALGELVHNILEAQQVRKKVEWLRLRLAGKEYVDSLPVAIDTRAKSYAISLVGLLATTGLFYGLFSLLSLPLHTALVTIVLLLVLAYVATAVLLDKYHVEIGAITPPQTFKKKLFAKKKK